MKFRTELKQYPNGAEYHAMFVGKTHIGNATAVGDGFLAAGRRKPVATLEEAAKQTLDSQMNACMAKHQELRKMLGHVLAEVISE